MQKGGKETDASHWNVASLGDGGLEWSTDSVEAQAALGRSRSQEYERKAKHGTQHQRPSQGSNQANRCSVGTKMS